MDMKIKLIDFTEMTDEQKQMVLTWRNNPNVRKWMYNQKEIPLEEHREFIESLKLSKDKRYFLVDSDKGYIGVIDFTDISKDSSYFGFYSNPESKIPGIGRILERVSIDYAFNVLKVGLLKLEVFVDNVKVVNLHKKFDFKITCEKVVLGHKVFCMELKNENR